MGEIREWSREVVEERVISSYPINILEYYDKKCG